MAQMHNPAHPGAVLREFLPKNLPVGEIASRLGVSRQALSALLNGRAGVSAEMACALKRPSCAAPKCGCRCRQTTTSGRRGSLGRRRCGASPPDAAKEKARATRRGP